MKRMRIFAVLLTIAGTLFVVSSPASATTGPGCHVISSFGAGTKSNMQPGPANGTGTVMINGLYTSPQETTVVGFDYRYFNNTSYKSGGTSADYATELLVWGTKVAVTDHPNHPVGYDLHGTWGPTYRTVGGVTRFWAKGDMIQIVIRVLVHPTLNHGYTQANCVL